MDILEILVREKNFFVPPKVGARSPPLGLCECVSISLSNIGPIFLSIYYFCIYYFCIYYFCIYYFLFIIFFSVCVLSQPFRAFILSILYEVLLKSIPTRWNAAGFRHMTLSEGLG